MSLVVLVAMVVAGVSAIVLAVHLTGGSARASLADAEAARLRFAEDYPDARVDRVALTADRHAAFLAVEGGVGIVEAVGDRFLTRLLTASDGLSPVRRDDLTMELATGDFTWKGGRYGFADAGEADAAMAIAGMQAQENA